MALRIGEVPVLRERRRVPVLLHGGDGELVEKRKIADHEVLGMVHYPNANSMLVFSQKGEITMWTVWFVCLMFNSFRMIKVFKAFNSRCSKPS